MDGLDLFRQNTEKSVWVASLCSNSDRGAETNSNLLWPFDEMNLIIYYHGIKYYHIHLIRYFLKQQVISSAYPTTWQQLIVLDEFLENSLQSPDTFDYFLIDRMGLVGGRVWSICSRFQTHSANLQHIHILCMVVCMYITTIKHLSD